MRISDLSSDVCSSDLYRLRSLQSFSRKCTQGCNPQPIESLPVFLLPIIPLEDAKPNGEGSAVSGRRVQQPRFTGSDIRPLFLQETVGLPSFIEKQCFCEYVQ